MANGWHDVTVKRREVGGSETYQLEHDGNRYRIRFHEDGSVRFAGAEKGEAWEFAAHEPGSPGTGAWVTREHGYPVIRVRPHR